MGWGDCGLDSNGRNIGYLFTAVCDHPGCSAIIDRGLSYVCGTMHGEDTYSCEKYFCEDHRVFVDIPNGGTEYLCLECAKLLNYIEEE